MHIKVDVRHHTRNSRSLFSLAANFAAVLNFPKLSVSGVILFIISRLCLTRDIVFLKNENSRKTPSIDKTAEKQYFPFSFLLSWRKRRDLWYAIFHAQLVTASIFLKRCRIRFIRSLHVVKNYRGRACTRAKRNRRAGPSRDCWMLRRLRTDSWTLQDVSTRTGESTI